MKKILFLAALSTISLSAMAQSGTNSPYSQFGLGKLSDQSQGLNRGMNGVGLAFREKNQVNYINPASYSAVDSLTFVFDIGMSLQNTNFKENGISKNAKNADFEYAVGSFRLVRHVGMSFGVVPYTNVGYSYSNTSTVDNYNILPSTDSNVTQTQSYTGDGGIRQLFIGAGWETPIKGLSIGANIGYLWGDVNNYVTNSYSDSYVKSLARQYTTDISSYKASFGLQYSYQIGKDDVATVGITYTPGHNLNADAELRVITSNTQSSVNDTTLMTATDAMSIPTELGLGLSYKRGTKWLLGLDYTFQKWSSATLPVYTESNSTATYTAQTNVFSDRHKINIGGQYCKDNMGRHFTDRLRYRFGASYASSYIKTANGNGPKELSISAGIGIPIMNAWNNRSTLNLGVQWQNLHGKDLLTENTLLINIGLTFNESWFAKWKFE